MHLEDPVHLEDPLHLEDRVAAGGDAIGRLPDGRIVFVEGALPGETVQADVVAERRDFAKARLRTVVSPSPWRTVGSCPHHHTGCGGCPWQDVTGDAQVTLKQRILLETVARIARTEPATVLPPVRLATEGYRTTLHLSVDGAGRVGFRRRHEDVAHPVDSCLVAHPALGGLLAGLRLPGHDRVTLRTGTADGRRLAVVHRRQRHRPAGLPDDVVLVGPGQQGAVHESVGGRHWRVSARSFFQAGPQAADAVVAAVDTAVGDSLPAGGLMVDAYAGVGIIGGVVAGRRGARLVSIESNRDSVADARVNLTDVEARVVATDVGRWSPQPADVVVADPSRTGLGRPGVTALAATGAPTLVLVSCDPASAARDAGLLAEAGYRLATLQVVDGFAHTVHIESVCRFEHGAPDRPK